MGFGVGEVDKHTSSLNLSFSPSRKSSLYSLVKRTAVYSTLKITTCQNTCDHVMCSLCSCVHVWMGENETCTHWRWRAGRWGQRCSCPRGGAGGKRGGQRLSPAPSFSRGDVRAVRWHRRQAEPLPGGDRLPGSAGGVWLWSSCLQAKKDHIIQVWIHSPRHMQVFDVLPKTWRSVAQKANLNSNSKAAVEMDFSTPQSCFKSAVPGALR